jgi:anion-transporting  ArsA/GET3 family ATPase
MSDFQDHITNMLRTQRVIVLIGSGGVGKTTSAIALAIAGARLGKRVALLSIDPAKRLASALGIPLGNQLVKVDFDSSAGVHGQLFAAMLDQKEVFDSMVKKHAPSPHIADRILRDPLYTSASTNLSGPLEYMALARLQELVDDEKNDLIVLDTPPDTHALDFLARPNVLSGFLEGTIVSKIIKPVVLASKFGLSKFAFAGEKILGGVAKITGVSALQALSEFILLMQDVLAGFNAAGERVLTTLKSPSTSFVLVSSPTSAATRSAEHLGAQLATLGYCVEGVILNKCLPTGVINDVQRQGDTNATFLKTRVTGEQKSRERLLKFLARTQSNRALWYCQLDETEIDLMTVAGILDFSIMIADKNRTRKLD